MAEEKDGEGGSSLENSGSRVGGVDSRYLATLQPQDRKRFQEKLKYVLDGELLEIQNPYESVVYSREVKEKTGIFILKAEVRPGQAESQNSYLAWIIAKRNGEILTAHCAG